MEREALACPSNVKVQDFIFSAGAATDDSVTVKTLGELIDRYLGSLKDGAKQENTLATEKTHHKHLRRLLGDKCPLDSINLAKIKFDYVAKRDVSAVTIEKELKTLRQLLHWGHDFCGLPPIAWKLENLELEFGRTQVHFSTYEAIERRIKRGGLDVEEIALLWKGLYFTSAEIADLLDWVEALVTDYGWLPKMVIVAALTGMRRSEILRSEVEDWDFARRVLTVREMKKRRGTLTLRHVEMHDRLASTLEPYVAGILGRYVFEGITEDMSNDHFNRTMAKHPKFKSVRGWHVLRHSFISSLAIAGVHVGIIQSFVGHLDDEMTAHYTHIAPQQTDRPIDKLLPG